MSFEVTSVEGSNPFKNTDVSTVSESRSVMESALANKELAEAQAKIFLAKQFPRNPVQCYETVMNSCRRQGLAMTAIYRFPRGKNEDGSLNYVTGPSIRLAEEIARGWKNIEAGWSELERSATTSRIKAYAWDLESNITKPIIFSIRLVRNTKKGTYPLTDERDIYELCANQAARRMRNCILALIPGDIVEDAIRECVRTINAKANITPERIRAMIEEFRKIGVTREQIEKKLGRKVDSITPAQFIDMTMIYTSIRDRIGDVDQYFDSIVSDQEHAKPKLDMSLADKINSAVSPKTSRSKKQEETISEQTMESEKNSELETGK